MDAAVLRDFFLGLRTGVQLRLDLDGTTVRRGHDSYEHRMVDLDDDFTIEADHLVKLCDAVLAGDLRPESLSTIAFGIIASDHFVWDTDSVVGERIGATLYDWSAPEVNFALNRDTVVKFRHRLLTGEITLNRADHEGRRQGRTIRYRSAGTGGDSA
jgi:hypothetical protein